MATKSKTPPRPEPEPDAFDARSRAATERELVLSRAVDLSRARLRGALREHDLGEAESATSRTAELTARLRRSSALISASERSRVPTVTAAPDRAVLHGRVTTTDGTGVEDAVVVVLDAHGQEAARVATASVGYFQFVFPPSRRSTAPGKEGMPDEVEIRVRVLAADSENPLKTSEPLTLSRGKVVYRELAVE